MKKKRETMERHREDAIVRKVEEAIRHVEREGNPIFQEAEKVVEVLRRAEKVFEENGRLDMANSIRAARLSLSAHIDNLAQA